MSLSYTGCTAQAHYFPAGGVQKQLQVTERARGAILGLGCRSSLHSVRYELPMQGRVGVVANFVMLTPVLVFVHSFFFLKPPA